MDENYGTWISPHYLYKQIDLNNASIDDRISILEDRIRGYYTIPSRLLDNIYENSILIVLLVIMSCIELLEIFYQGESSNYKSRKFFKSGFKRIYIPEAPDYIPNEQFKKDLDSILEDLYKQVRCGLAHTASTRSKVIISKSIINPARIDFDSATNEVKSIHLNPRRALLELDIYLSSYCSQLRNPDNKDLRENFEKGWEALRKDG